MIKIDKVKSIQKEEVKSLEILIIDDNEQITRMLTTFLELKSTNVQWQVKEKKG